MMTLVYQTLFKFFLTFCFLSIHLIFCSVLYSIIILVLFYRTPLFHFKEDKSDENVEVERNKVIKMLWMKNKDVDKNVLYK